ncbi:hypothetical protein Pmar_PMAR025776, partial [Perkinsus marinus ATCC 50983]
IASTKYRLLTFVPLNLWEQFHRVANLWFLLVGICQMLPYNLSPTSEWATIVPLVFVLSLTMIKDAIEDYRRYMNDTKVCIRVSHGPCHRRVEPAHDHMLELSYQADMLLIATSDPDGTVYVETSQLDGESALKVKQALPETRRMFSSIPLVSECVGSMTCDAPNALIDEFNGLFRLRGGLREPADAKNLVLRGSSIRNTAWCCGVVVYVGRDTKLAMNMTPNAPIKRSKVELQINRYLGFVLGFMLALSLGLTIAFACTRDSRDSECHVSQRQNAFQRQQFLTFLLLFNNMVPISLYVTVDIVRSIQAYFIQRDPYLKEGQHSIIVGASGLNDDLGRVDYVLVDKTGTLTENRMSFKTCSIGGVQYGSEEKAPTAESIHSDNLYSWRSNKMLPDTEKNRLRDEALLEYLGVSAITRPQDAFVHLFMLTCAICNTVIVETSTKSLIGVRFQGASPDEEALVEMAASSGYILTNRSSDFVSLRILRPSPAGKERQWEDTTFKILGVNEFTSERKRMSILVQIMKTIETDEGDIAYIPDGSGSMLLVKGADDVMVELCQRGVGEASAIALCGVPVRDVREETVFDINEFASTGLRTLMLAMRYLDEVETSEYLGALNEARHSITNRADRFAQIADKFETNLIVLGATAVEDKIQRGVNITVCRMLNAGVKVWMLTGDRYETSLNIARAVELLPRNAYVSNLCSNYERGMSNEAADAFVRQKQKNFEDEYLKWTARGKTSCLCVVLDGSAIDCFSSSKSNSIILSSILMNTGSVVACRCSPSQKALIVQLLKKADDCITLAIGDGANDVPMLEVANIGIGVIGSEGMQAVRASDYAIATFSHLGQLMLIHGRDCYNRITLVILYSFFKNIFLILPNVFFALSNAFTGTSLYDSWILMSYNVFWTSLPIIVIGAMDITLPRWVVVRYPIVYVEGRKSFSFNARKFIVWILGATFCAAVAYVSVAVVVGYSSVITPSGELMSHACMAEFYVMRIVDGVDDSLLAAWIPFSVHIAAQIRFPRALALSIVHIICFITIHLVRTLEIHHGSSMDGHDSRDCGVEFNNLCQLLDYLPMMLAITSMSAALGYKTELDQRSHYLVSLNSKVEQSRSKEVLNNMLPDFVVDSIIEHNRGLPFGSSTESRLLSRRSTESSSKTGSSRIPSTLEIGTFARHCGDVTVLFCDVADFPQLVAALVPKQLILMIHRLFSNIDKLVFVHALTKLETVSESYVVCSGLNPDGDSSDHVVSKDAFRAVLLGLDILDNTAHMNVPAHTGPDECMRGFAIALVLKIGIHTGPVISGVVGSKRPQFCIFGDTINTASRMKSTAIPNRVHLSASTRECLEFSSSLSFEERETFVKGKGVLMTYDASRVVDSSHLQDVGAMSTSRDLAVSFDTSKVEKLGGIEPLRRHSQASLGGSATSTLTAPVRKLIASLKPSIRWRNGAEESLDEQAYDAFHSSSPWLAGSDVSCNERTINFDKSRDLNLAVEALRRNNDRYDVQKEHAVERMDLGKDRASMYTMEFLQSSYEIRFREGRLMTFVTSRSTRYVLLILSVSYLIQTIELLVAPQQPQVIFSRVLLARLTVWILLMVLYVLYSLRSLLSAPALRLLTVGVYAIGILVASLHTLVFVENVRRDDCDADDPTCSNLSITESPAATGYHSYANSLELTMWLIMINFNAALLFKHLLYINIIILIPVVISWNFSEYIGSDLAAEALEAYLADRYMASLYKNMTLLFADICNYTAYAKSAPAERVVSLLTTLFSRFDSLSDTYAVYKVHTIGDAYVASTEPKEGVDKVQSARRMVSFAQAMVEALHTVRQEMSAPDLEMRIGLHFGKFVGGVIATTKISYDIFGVDVTIANQVETAGIPGKIVASNSLRGYLVHYFPGKYRFRFHTTIETLVPDDSSEYFQRGAADRSSPKQCSVVAKQLKIYEISTSKMQYGQFDTVI